MRHAFIFLLTLLVHLLRAACKSRDELVLENLSLRQQVTALKLGKHKPKLHDADRAFWIALRKTWANWASRILIVKPETVVDWQRRRFRRHWARISQEGRSPGRPAAGAEIRELIRQMVRENHWGALTRTVAIWDSRETRQITGRWHGGRRLMRRWWKPDRCDDGGFTGVNIERPAFQRLLADVVASKEQSA